MRIIENYSLKQHNTFGVQAQAATWIEATQPKQVLQWLAKEKPLLSELLIIGQASNILFVTDWPGYMIRPAIYGRELIYEDSESVHIRLGAAEDWDQIVEWTVSQGWAGLENLSLIPGTVGAAPVQNIGAYGVEFADSLRQVEFIDLELTQSKTYNHADCNFAYRTSIFKQYPYKYMISHVVLKLSKKPQYKLHYRALAKHFGNKKPSSLTEIRQAVIDIRNEKLPDPKDLGSAGSFFKNPVISAGQAARLRTEYPDMVQFPLANNDVKLAAAWLIEYLGWKGHRNGDAGIFPQQALVLVNYGNATGEDIYQLAMRIRSSVLRKFGVMLEEEVNIVRAVAGRSNKTNKG